MLLRNENSIIPESDLSFDSTTVLEKQLRSQLCARFPSTVVKPKSCATLSGIIKLSLLRSSSIHKFQPYISTQEMFKISEFISRIFSPSQPIKTPGSPIKAAISTQQLLEVSHNISLYYAPKPSTTAQNLTLLSISPQQLYVYWNLGGNNMHLLHPFIRNDNLILRITAQDSIKGHSKLIFETPIYDIHHQKKVTLPLTNNNTIYSAKIGSNTIENKFEAILLSNKLAFFSATEHKHKPTHIAPPAITKTAPTSLNVQSHYFNSNRSGQGKKSLKK